MKRTPLWIAVLGALTWASEGLATDVTGTAQLQGQVVLAAPIPGINPPRPMVIWMLTVPRSG